MDCTFPAERLSTKSCSLLRRVLKKYSASFTLSMALSCLCNVYLKLMFPKFGIIGLPPVVGKSNLGKFEKSMFGMFGILGMLIGATAGGAGILGDGLLSTTGLLGIMSP